MPTQEQMDFARERVQKSFGKALLTPISGMTVIPNTMLTSGREIRDTKIWKLPILPEAILVFQQLASSREWSVSGELKYAQRALEGLHRSVTINPSNGFVNYGFEDFAKRRVLDYLSVGRTSFTYNSRRNCLEYLDPTRLTYAPTFETEAQRHEGVRDTDLTWRYNNYRSMRFRDVVLNHPFPIGVDYFIAPVVTLLPTAILAWLMREHDMSALDGRKIREILFVGSTTMQTALETAVNMMAALYTGASVQEVGIPVVEINNPSGGKIQDQIGRLGISEIPDSFNREEFIFQYVNEIAAALGLALRHFWNNERTTNRALEVVQEQRQQQKGPSSFVRTEQRLINESGFLERIAGGRNKKLRFAYIEEVDTASQKDRSEVLASNADALERISRVFGATISPDSYLRWMQSIGVLPHDLEITTPDGIKESDGTVEEVASMNAEGETTVEADGDMAGKDPNEHNPADNFRKSAPIEDNEYTLDMNGKIIDYRFKAFTVNRVMQKHIGREVAEERQEIEVVDQTVEESFSEIKYANALAFRELYTYHYETVEDYLKNCNVMQREKFTDAISAVMSQNALSNEEQGLIEDLLLEVGGND